MSNITVVYLSEQVSELTAERDTLRAQLTDYETGLVCGHRRADLDDLGGCISCSIREVVEAADRRAKGAEGQIEDLRESLATAAETARCGGLESAAALMDKNESRASEWTGHSATQGKEYAELYRALAHQIRSLIITEAPDSSDES